MYRDITLTLSQDAVVEILTSLSYARDFYARETDSNYRDYWEKRLLINKEIENDILNQTKIVE